MNRALYTSAIGMMTQMKNMDVITNNIANVDTTGFKKEETVVQTFSEEMFKIMNDKKEYYALTKFDDNIGDMALGNYVSLVHTDFAQGSLRTTNNPYDFALEGSGFFCISTQDNNGNEVERYTRDGTFTLNQDGVLITKSGYPVLGENGPITLDSVNIKVNEHGELYSEGEFIDKLKIVDFENLESLRKYGENLYDAIDESVQIESNAVVLQEITENSNVNTVSEMVKMISVSRVYEMGQKLVQTQDSILGKAVNDIARKV